MQHDPVIAYYCLLFVVQEGMSIAKRSKDTTTYLMQLMDQLEEMKKSPALTQNELVTNEEAAFSYCENFALKIFLKADTEDRQGQSSKKTAMSFLASSVFLQMLKQFKQQVDTGEVDEKIRYAKWKAADIAKSLREGKQPQPGPPGSATGEDASTTQPLNSANVPKISSPSAPNEEPAKRTSLTPPKYAPLKQAPQSHSATDTTASIMKYDTMTLEKAQKHSKFAISALQYEDIKTAVDNLEKALALLKPLLNERH